MSDPIRVGLIGAGYIASWHAEALRATAGVTIAAICDVSENAARGLAEAYGATAFTSVEALIESGTCDAVHILTPPHLHKALAIQCMHGGLDVLVEKPVAESAEDTQAMEDVTQASGQTFHAGHNFLGLPRYEQMKAAVQRGDYGRISAAEITWAYPLAPLRSGPFNLWMLRAPKNLLLELGPHLFAFAVDLFGPLDILHTSVSKPTPLPGGDSRPQAFRVLAKAGAVDITFTFSMVETVDDRSVTLRGSSARARLDFASDVLVVERENASDLVINPLRRQLALSRQHLAEGVKNAFVQATSLNTKSPYGRSFRAMASAIYYGQGAAFSGARAVTVMTAIDDAIAKMPPEALTPPAPVVQTRTPKPSAMVIGGTGFIGRALTRKLVAAGRDVRVVSRGARGPFPDLPDQVETVGVSFFDEEALVAAMQGCDVVYNLAKSLNTTWEDCLKNDVGVAVRIAQASQKAGVKRLIYSGTIASYDMADPNRVITEETGFAPDMSDRNFYARSKAESEKQLMALHHEQGLPLVIVRPGIVVGQGGPLQHWGIGRWHGAGAVRIWGHGRNTLPFVLNDDVADALVMIAEAGDVDGQSFNLVGEPMFSARDYFDKIAETLGARIQVSPGNLYGFYASDTVKYALKKYVLRRHGVVRPSLIDWKSRAHFSPFANAWSKQKLGWSPEADKDAFVSRAIRDVNLLGF